MSIHSSTSSSDEGAAWGHCLVACYGTLLAAAALIFLAMILVDPYDSGLFGVLGIKGVDDRIEALADVSRARDPQFDSAVFGNSTVQLLDPAELSPATGKRFMQLVAPGADPRGHIAIMEFFIRHHRQIGAFVVGIDSAWCVHSMPPLQKNAFPFWLYNESKFDYASNLFTWRSLDHLFRRIAIGLGTRQAMRADGFWSYEEVWPPGGKRPDLTQVKMSPSSHGIIPAFPVKTLLEETIQKLSPDVPVVFIMPPTFYTLVPPPGTQEAAEHAACKASYRSIIAGRAHSDILDYRIDNALTRDPNNFADLIHYRAKIARKLEPGIAAILRDGNAARIEF
jgi:hypothetical protein